MRHDPLSLAMRGLIQLYRWFISPLLGPRCRHMPSCSEYAMEAIELHGPWKGGWLAASRISRCHPWGSHGFDPVPRALPHVPWYMPWGYGRWSRKNEVRDEK
jgi:putative membrane protein insertion efficiency factor